MVEESSPPRNWNERAWRFAENTWTLVAVSVAASLITGRTLLALAWLFLAIAVRRSEMFQGLTRRRMCELISVGILAIMALLGGHFVPPRAGSIDEKVTELTKAVRATGSSALEAVQPASSSTAAEKPRGTVEYSVIPYAIAHRRPKKEGMKLVTDWGVSAVLYVRNTTNQPKQIQRLDVVGDVEVECQDYLSALPDDRIKSGATLDDLAAECLDLRPYRTLHWIAYPIESGRVEAGGAEAYIRFTFLEPENWGMRIGLGKNKGADYFGSITHKQPAKLATTSVHCLDLIKFKGVSDTGDRSEFYGPVLRSERSGKSFFRVLVDGAVVAVPKGKMGAAKWALDEEWRTRTPANLFRGMTGTSWDRLDELEPARR